MVGEFFIGEKGEKLKLKVFSFSQKCSNMDSSDAATFSKMTLGMTTLSLMDLPQ